ncbi:hypothetical protein ACM5Q9_08255 [Advenella sp. RU8]|uniref:hypothetical protein n=1 Tax=Advenella sp. RU8 TaxID=3399575 RepID=UPI003AAF663C
MRECLDCGVLMVPTFEKRIQAFIDKANSNTRKLNLYPVNLIEDDCSGNMSLVQAKQQDAYPDPSVLSSLSQRLQRFDVILLPVSQDSLVWTRMLLQQTPVSLLRPVVALSKEIHPVAMYDLLCLGATDFSFEPDQIEALRIRLLMILRNEQGRQLLNQTGTPVLQDKAREGHGMSKFAKPVFNSNACCRDLASQANSYKEAKSKVVTHFEKTYVSNALFKCGGNIAMAARMSSKHRRAFWALMQKHDISADQFKDIL